MSHMRIKLVAVVRAFLRVAADRQLQANLI